MERYLAQAVQPDDVEHAAHVAYVMTQVVKERAGVVLP
ncbi:hypothetical protein AWB77_02116 [Caballeronia fortuita]|uniref:Uncharacterized protein n=1 Tax=Caballeronia fortuita TaxID=1777138 RepID=A0A158AU73_9BURK|nr:hypothetical protein AWB77_02116 [Caballeronia fortuita]